MSAPRAAAVVLIGLGAALATAQATELSPPQLRVSQVAPDAVESAPPLRPTEGVAEIVVPALPEIVVQMAPAATLPAASLDLPLPPVAEITLTPTDVFGAALARAVTDNSFEAPKRLRKPERDAIAAFYALGDFKPLFVENGRPTARALQVAETLKNAAADGLDADDYPIPVFGATTSAADLAAAELKFAAAAILYARDARGARIEPGRLSRLVTPTLAIPAADAVLTAIAAAPDAGTALAGFQPPHAGYVALKQKLASLRAEQALPGRLESDILANMERWRWLPADLGRRHVFVNVPEYKLRLVEDGRPIHEARVIVGKSDTQTPLFSDEMDHAVVNPSWYVPPSIFKNEFNSDPALAAAKGYDVAYGKNGQVSIRQPPGERNALGFIKFMFPNQHAVYIHDTPNRGLFGAQKRAFSHGCVRLDQPFRFADFVLGAEWSEQRLKKLIGSGERRINLPHKIPVHLTYFTTFVDETGELRQIPDIYATNNKVRMALGFASDGTAVAAAPKPKPPRPTTASAPRPVFAAEGTAQVSVRAPAPAPIRESFFPIWMSR